MQQKISAKFIPQLNLTPQLTLFLQLRSDYEPPCSIADCQT